MNRKQYNKLVPGTIDEVSKKIRLMAEYIVDNDCTNVDGTHIVGEARDVLVFDKAMDMVIGEKMTMKKHLITGTLIGTGATIVIGIITRKIMTNKEIKKGSN